MTPFKPFHRLLKKSKESKFKRTNKKKVKSTTNLASTAIKLKFSQQTPAPSSKLLFKKKQKNKKKNKNKKTKKTRHPTANHEEDERGKGRENKKQTWNEDLWTYQVYCQHQLMSKPTKKSVFFSSFFFMPFVIFSSAS